MAHPLHSLSDIVYSGHGWTPPATELPLSRTVEHFLRYNRFVTTGTVSGDPVVQIAIIGKSCG